MRVLFLSLVLLAGCAGGPIRQSSFPTLTVTAAPPNEARVKLTDDAIKLKDKVKFEVGSSKIAEESFVVLDEIAQVLHENEDIEVLRIEGHTDSTGSRGANLRLSRARARAVRKYLVKQAGIAPSRIVAKGFGPDAPLADNESEEGREENRRVEFNIERRAVAQDGGR